MSENEQTPANAGENAEVKPENSAFFRCLCLLHSAGALSMLTVAPPLSHDPLVTCCRSDDYLQLR